jgi:hypothetical protein
MQRRPILSRAIRPKIDTNWPRLQQVLSEIGGQGGDAIVFGADEQDLESICNRVVNQYGIALDLGWAHGYLPGDHSQTRLLSGSNSSALAYLGFGRAPMTGSSRQSTHSSQKKEGLNGATHFLGVGSGVICPSA